MRADLHSHTIYSDGTFEVIDLMKRAKNNGLDILAITDHDCFEGTNLALSLNDEVGIKTIYGIELSTKRNGESIHVLGYYNKPLRSGKLFDMMYEQRMNRKSRAYEIARLLKVHFNIDLDTTFIEKKNSVTRGTIGDELLKQGFVKTKAEAFTKMIGDNCPCYLPSTELSTEEGIKLINESGGMSVLAHPCLYKKNDVEEIIKMGVKGIEAVYPGIQNHETKYRDLAKKYNILVTAGSDFHLPNDYKHGDVGDCYIKDQDLRKFLNALNEY